MTFVNEVMIVDSDGHRMRIDPVLLGPPMNKGTRVKIRQGEKFIFSDTSGSVGLNGKAFWLISSSSLDDSAHCMISISCDNYSLIQFAENPTIRDWGNSVAPINLNRASEVTSSISFFKNSSLADGTSTLLFKTFVGISGSYNVCPIGVSAALTEWVLTGSKNYGIAVVPKAGITNCSIIVEYYETDEPIV